MKLIKFVCPVCGGDNVLGLSTTSWDVKAQLWVGDGDLHDGGNYCSDCDEVVGEFVEEDTGEVGDLSV